MQYIIYNWRIVLTAYEDRKRNKAPEGGTGGVFPRWQSQQGENQSLIFAQLC